MVVLARLLTGKQIDPRRTHPLGFGRPGVPGLRPGDHPRKKAATKRGTWSSERFARENALGQPLTQFKVLYNMPLCLAPMELDLVNENSVTHGLDEGMLVSAVATAWENDMILATRCRADGEDRCVAALARRDEIPLDRRGDILEILGSGPDDGTCLPLRRGVVSPIGSGWDEFRQESPGGPPRLRAADGVRWNAPSVHLAAGSPREREGDPQR
ncbi:MAG: hypothetical protein IPN71_14100 [Fibrobacteres bacterium]|nr:hypothetical protein [Fibrobacterota bacterium]